MRSDLQKLSGVTNIKTDVASQVCTFEVSDPKLDVKSVLSDLAKTNEHIAGWSMIE